MRQQSCIRATSRLSSDLLFRQLGFAATVDFDGLTKGPHIIVSSRSSHSGGTQRRLVSKKAPVGGLPYVLPQQSLVTLGLYALLSCGEIAVKLDHVAIVVKSNGASSKKEENRAENRAEFPARPVSRRKPWSNGSSNRTTVCVILEGWASSL